MFSTQNLAVLPTIGRLRTLSQTLATLDAILCPEWQYRYYSFNAHWDTGEMMASMHNGSGDSYFLLFSEAGAILKGFAHEAPMSPYRHEPPQLWPGIFDGIPSEFAAFLAEPAFSIDDTTFCIWRTASDTQWHRGQINYPQHADPDGSASLLSIFDNKPETYQTWAEEYYQRPVNLEAVRSLYTYQPVTGSLIVALNDDLTLDDLRSDLDEIQYPY